jgi:hypothetical protein
MQNLYNIANNIQNNTANMHNIIKMKYMEM